ncbi:uncharacterized protein LOC130754653 [Actinidia eriantha]|uniref:uncharacterized protein LOC130754653 n=1 Tax=Actinidia eriantha TaxID=165200 RepID=UPI00258286FC|nr:uncharacterized protein LOC130754653 [Actinidia eriantha]
MGSHLFHLHASSRPPPICRLSAYSSTLIRRYSQPSKESGGHEMERAPSTAEEFQRVAEEFERVAEAKARQGVASQTIEKARNGTEEAALGDSAVESVKEKYKESPDAGNFHKTGDE